MKLTTKQIKDSEKLFTEMAIDTVRINAITNRVIAIRKHMKETQQISAIPSPAIIRTMGSYKMSLRIAAATILLIGSAVLYKYISVNDQSFYNSQFAGYEVESSRGGEFTSAEVDAYEDKDWNTVVAIYKIQHTNSNKAGFLAAMAEMQLNHFSEAVTIFEHIVKNGSADQSFKEESEYYLALAYIMNHEVEKSIPLINKIKKNPGHTYFPLVSKFSSIDLKIIELKKK